MGAGTYIIYESRNSYGLLDQHCCNWQGESTKVEIHMVFQTHRYPPTAGNLRKQKFIWSFRQGRLNRPYEIYESRNSYGLLDRVMAQRPLDIYESRNSYGLLDGVSVFKCPHLRKQKFIWSFRLKRISSGPTNLRKQKFIWSFRHDDQANWCLIYESRNSYGLLDVYNVMDALESTKVEIHMVFQTFFHKGRPGYLRKQKFIWSFRRKGYRS